jgi:endonuclease/exonuclease/phosphatase family metal-dependent hydrolase
VRVASFNIRGARIDGGAGFAPLVDACVGLDADILGLQEVDRRRRRSGFVDQAAAVAHALGGAHVYGPTRPRRPRGQYGNALVARGEIRSSEVRVLPGAGTQQPRAAVLARVDVQGMSVSVAVTHLQHHPRRLAHLPDEAPEQLRMLLSWLRDLPSPRVLVGDLNLQPPRAAPILEEAGYTIAATGPAYPSADPRLQLDYIAVDGLVVQSASVVPTGEISDHHPIVADLERAH